MVLKQPIKGKDGKENLNEVYFFDVFKDFLKPKEKLRNEYIFNFYLT